VLLVQPTPGPCSNIKKAGSTAWRRLTLIFPRNGRAGILNIVLVLCIDSAVMYNRVLNRNCGNMRRNGQRDDGGARRWCSGCAGDIINLSEGSMDGGSTTGIAPRLRAGVRIGVGKGPIPTEWGIVRFASSGCRVGSSLEPWIGLTLSRMSGMSALPGVTFSWLRLVEQRDWAGSLKQGEVQLWASHKAG